MSAFCYLFILQILVANSIASNEEFFRFPGTANNLHRIQRSDEYIKGWEFHILNESMNNAMLMAFKNCQEQMMWERWNCPKRDFLRYHKMKKTKEQAFMESLSAAATMYTVIQNCLQGKFSRCKCFEMRSNCSTCPFRAKDMMKFGRRIVKKYLNDKKYSIDEVRMHNQNVGIITVKKMIHWNETCISKTPILPFRKIAAVLKTRWLRAKKLQDFNVPWFSKEKKFKKILKKELAYIDQSQDYCLRQELSEINGTEGRVCLEKKYGESIEPSQTETCHRLCYSCGYKVNERVIQFHKRCNCRKNGCCSVRCEICYSRKIAYVCSRK